jgi:futalosine hydrolase
MNTLILIPTESERRWLAEPLASCLVAGDRMELCGFGPVVAAARTAALVAACRPERVLLVGIAGAYAESLATGSGFVFGEVGCYGVGVGVGAGFVPAGELGWPQWPGEAGLGGVLPGASRGSDAVLAESAGARRGVGDTLGCLFGGGELGSTGMLLTVCAAAASAREVADRLRLFPTAVAEDMEGFGVAAACQMAGVPCGIVRGISNRAGDRNVAGWQIGPALSAAADLACRILGERS